MPDNVTLNLGTGGSVVRTDDDGTAHWQYVKPAFGADNTQTIVTSTVGLPVELLAGTASIGALAANSGVDIGDVDVTSIIPGIGATNLGKSIDAVAGATDTGTLGLAVRRAVDTPISGLDGDYEPLKTSADGHLKVEIFDGGDSHTIDGTVAANAGTGDFLTPIGHTINEAFKESGCIGGQLDDTATTAATENNVAPARITAQRAIHVNLRNNAGTELGDATTPVVVDLGSNNDVTIAANSSVNVNQVGGTTVVTGGVAGSQGVGGLAADGAAVAGSPVLIAGSDGTNAQNILVTTNGRQVFCAGTAAADGGSNTLCQPFTSATQSFKSAVAGHMFNGSTWDRIRGDITNGLDVDVTRIAAGTNLIGDLGLSGARTSGGTTLFKTIDLDETEEEVKATAGQVYWIHAMNLANVIRFLKFYNATAATVVVGTTVPDLTFPLPTQGDTNGAGFTLSIPNGVAFGTAITIAATTGLADADAGAPGANEVVVNLGFA